MPPRLLHTVLVLVVALAAFASSAVAAEEAPPRSEDPLAAAASDRDAGSERTARTLGERRLAVGRKGSDVRRLQALLTRRFGFPTEIDGRFGSGTARSVRHYERWLRLPLDGAVDPAQGRRMVRHAARLARGKESYRFGERDLEVGSRGRDVAKLQRLLTRMRIETDTDGAFGPATEESVRRYERWRGEQADGAVPQEQAHVLERRAKRGAEMPAPDQAGGGAHAFPVRGPYSFGGSGSRFGAPRPGRTHQGQDIAAASGTPIVSVHSGVVSTRQYQRGGAGNYLVIRGDDRSDSVYMHMLHPGLVAPGERVRAGQTIGYVGSTGGSSGPHLHFELWTPHWYAGGAPYDPLPALRRWAG